MLVVRTIRGPGFVSSRNAPERRSGPFRYIAAKFRFHLNESDKFALFGSKMPSASAPPPDPHIGSRSRARHILSVPVLFLTGNEPARARLQNILLLPYDNGKVTIDLRPTSNLQNILRRAQGFLRYDSLAQL